MKLLVNIGTDYHLNLLPHFLRHYTALGIDQFLCGLHGSRLQEARQILADYPVEIVAHFGTVRFDEVSSRYWLANFNRIRREHVSPDEWCLYADTDELHEYPPDFFANLDPRINVVRGNWIERLATPDGQLLACRPGGNIGQQYPFGTREIFCGISEKIMAARGDLDVVFGYHHITGGADTPVYYRDYLNVHHFRWDEHAVAKYQDRKWTRHYQLRDGRVPDLRGVFLVAPPFPPLSPADEQPNALAAAVFPTHPARWRVAQERKTVFFLRHPFAVALAKLSMKEQHGVDEPQQLLTNSPLLNAVLQPFADVIELAESKFEKQVLVWAMIHYAAFAQLDETQVHLVFFEELCADFAQAVQWLRAFLGNDAPGAELAAWLWQPFQLPPPTTQARPAMHPHSHLLNDWQQQLTAEDLGMGDYILNSFGLGQLYNSNHAMPNRAAAEFLLNAASNANRAAPYPPQVSIPTLDTPSATNQDPRKLAYLIVAHHQPNHLARLIRTLADDDSYFFIHIDDKVAIAPFKAAVRPCDHIVFLPNRMQVQWGKLSVVQAILNLIQTAVTSGHAFKYYTVLSGSDYPIKHRTEICARLHDSDRQFLRIDRKLTSAVGNSHAHFIKNLPQGKYYATLTPYHGSMYWSLTADCIRFVLDFVRDHPGYLDLHRDVFAPDEVFFHTLVKHSPFADTITHDFSDGVYPDHTHHGNHFIDWQGLRPRSYLTLDERDLADLLWSNALFARKFDEQKSSKLLDLLDAQVHKIVSSQSLGG